MGSKLFYADGQTKTNTTSQFYDCVVNESQNPERTKHSMQTVKNGVDLAGNTSSVCVRACVRVFVWEGAIVCTPPMRSTDQIKINKSRVSMVTIFIAFRALLPETDIMDTINRSEADRNK
jgi:hypothetical protein